MPQGAKRTTLLCARPRRGFYDAGRSTFGEAQARGRGGRVGGVPRNRDCSDHRHPQTPLSIGFFGRKMRAFVTRCTTTPYRDHLTHHIMGKLEKYAATSVARTCSWANRGGPAITHYRGPRAPGDRAIWAVVATGDSEKGAPYSSASHRPAGRWGRAGGANGHPHPHHHRPPPPGTGQYIAPHTLSTRPSVHPSGY